MKIIHYLLDLIFPKSEVLQTLESLSANEIYNRCAKSRPISQNIFPIFSYKEPLVKETVWQMKFNGDRRYAEICGQLLYKKIIAEVTKVTAKNNSESRGAIFLLIPIPIHPKRRRERGYNQCEWLCEEIKKFDIGNIFEYRPNAILRAIYQSKQSWSDRETRLKNIKGIFRIMDEKIIAGRNIIIIDDVYTTGATVHEMRETLVLSGAKKVFTFTIAH